MATGGMKELRDYLLKTIGIPLCEHISNEVYEAINYFLAQYYSEYTPKYYQRSYDLLHSAFKTSPKIIGDSVVIEVGIDYESLDNYEEATGWDVVNWSNEKTHGGSNVGTDTSVFDDAIDSTIISGQILKDCITFLRGKGYTIIT